MYNVYDNIGLYYILLTAGYRLAEYSTFCNIPSRRLVIHSTLFHFWFKTRLFTNFSTLFPPSGFTRYGLSTRPYLLSISQGGHWSLKGLESPWKSIHFFRTWKKSLNRIGPWKFWNLMWKVLESPRVSVLHNHRYYDLIILQSILHWLPNPALYTLDFCHWIARLVN